jgi:uroporphyrinogen-III decarboxylase
LSGVVFMNNQQWKCLLDVIAGKSNGTPPVGFIIDSPWMPGWAGISTLDYFTNDNLWFEANRKAVETFGEVLFLPGFWSEYGMCTEPSAFGAKCTWHQNELPFADKVIWQIEDIDRLTCPNPQTDGMAPFVLNRLQTYRKPIEKMGHAIRFAVTRGPLNIASFLMGTTEFLMALRTDTAKIHTLLKIVTDYTVSWLGVQKQTFDTIDGILLLDDIVGFCGPDDFMEFASPYLTQIYNSLNVSVKLFHNDADGRVCAPHLSKIGINLFNFSFLHSMEEMRQWVGNQVTLLGNIPPRDVMAVATPAQVSESVKQMLGPIKDKRRIIASCGGGMTGGTSSENIRAFIDAVGK